MTGDGRTPTNHFWVIRTLCDLSVNAAAVAFVMFYFDHFEVAIPSLTVAVACGISGTFLLRKRNRDRLNGKMGDQS